MPSNARRVALPCALVAIVALADPLSAQITNERGETTRTMAKSAGAIAGTEWLGRSERPAPDWTVDEPLWQGPRAMFVEQQLAQRAVRGWWPEQIADAKADAILDGFAWYLATRGIEHMYDLLYLRTAHSAESRRYFGDHLIWSFPALPLSRHAAVSHDRYAPVFDSLERWIGTPALQSALFEVAHLPADRLNAGVIINTISDAAGQDLSWAFDMATTDVNYAVDSVSEKSVTVSRRGQASVPSNVIMLKVEFAEGPPVCVHWDGRDEVRTFSFEGPSRVVAAYLDPDRIVTLDSNRLDNAIVARAPTNVPVRKWTARWMVWLQHTMLSYGFLA
jgi:hypothetical protein